MPHPRWVGRAGAALAVLVLGAGCATGGGSPEPTAGRDSSASPTLSRTPASASASQPRTPDPPPDTEDPVAYVPWGPADPVIPEHYGRLAQRDCVGGRSVAPEDPFWDAVFAVCATLTGQAPWPDLAQIPQPPATDNPHAACLDEELADMLERALSWRAAHGDATPEVAYPETGSTCYHRVYRTRQLPAAEDGTDPAPDEVTVEILADGTYDVAAISVDGTALAEGDVSDAGNDPFSGVRTLSLHVPRPESPVELTIEVALEQQGSPRGSLTATVAVAPTDAGSAPEDPGTGSAASQSPASGADPGSAQGSGAP